MAAARQRWKADQPSLDAKRLVFVDETGTSTKMVRTHGRCRRGRRLIGKAPWGHWKTTTFTAGLRCDGLVAPFVLDGPMNGEAFLVYVETVLAPGSWRSCSPLPSSDGITTRARGTHPPDFSSYERNQIR